MVVWLGLAWFGLVWFGLVWFVWRARARSKQQKINRGQRAHTFGLEEVKLSKRVEQ
jgi:cbb3-type cytochrome oxidase subunit 3